MGSENDDWCSAPMRIFRGTWKSSSSKNLQRPRIEGSETTRSGYTAAIRVERVVRNSSLRNAQNAHSAPVNLRPIIVPLVP